MTFLIVCLSGPKLSILTIAIESSYKRVQCNKTKTNKKSAAVFEFTRDTPISHSRASYVMSGWVLWKKYSQKTKLYVIMRAVSQNYIFLQDTEYIL